uniref:Retrovirus-related Pol polyprotein from transposon 17.6 n=1 Tax=Cajanus cajan TaxID=3821 RepID=A0A151UDB9_CAJCA
MSSPVTSDSKINTSASISRKEVSDRIAKGLCRFCGDKWDKNHKMKCKVWGKLNAIFSAQEEIAEDIMQDKDCEEEQAIVDRSIAMIQDEEVHISLNALQGIAGGNTLQLKGLIKHQKVPFLMDTGSTHNFISDKWVKVLGLKTQFVKDFPVIVASDKKLLITRKCEQTTWRFSDHTFTADFLVLPSKTFGIILGMQWFKTLEEIYWNCATLTMRFNHQALLNVADIGDQETLTTEQQQELTTLLHQFQQLFVEPTKLPPRRKSDHKIILINDTPVCSKPYRYPHAQKEEIERQVQGLLEKGFIRESTSSYASPLVLVKKKDGSWRCCTDFRKLNAFTIKNKFPMRETFINSCFLKGIPKNCLSIFNSSRHCFFIFIFMYP